MPKTRIISKKDNLFHDETLRLINNLRTDELSGLILPKDLARERHALCGACGKPYDKKQVVIYFDEPFHKTCVDKMLHGEKPI